MSIRDCVVLYKDDNATGVSVDTVDKLRKMFTYLDTMSDPEEFTAVASWKATS